MNRIRVFPLIAGLSVFLTAALVTPLHARYSKSEFAANGFPMPVSNRIFSIPLDPRELMVVYPAMMETDARRLQALLAARCGREIPFRPADSLKKEDLAGKNLIVVGNISDNRWALDLYKQRYAFADAVFPGKGGYFIHPAASIWDRERNVLVIGVSSDADLASGFEAFVSLLPNGTGRIESLHQLKTSVEFPPPPESVAKIFDDVRRNVRIAIPPYGTIANWGMNYFFTGNRKWAEHFRDGMNFLYERAEKTGDWVPELWTNVYFVLRNLVMAWDLIDDDPFFTARDRKIVEESLWGLSQFVHRMILLDRTVAPVGEPRQNHTAHMGLGLFYAYTYYTRKYGMTGLESMADQFRLAFDEGQANSYRPNDDAAGYQLASPGDYLNYAMAKGDDAFLKKGRLRQYIDLLAATTDNRKDVVGFGDTGSYAPFSRGSSRGLPHFARMAAWYYNDGQYQWLADWLSPDRKPGNMDLGDYAVEMKAESPTRFSGIFPVLLDEASLLFSTRRAEKQSWLPEGGNRYFDKISLRRNFDPRDEYLCLEGTSFFSHGHHDGNTVTRLTWKDRIWLCDLHYIDFTARNHNGVVVTFNGRQADPPPLNSLDCRADFDGVGLLKTTSRDYNRADWERHIIWRKGRYFLFLDRVTTLAEGEYRFDGRWRTRGEVELSGNTLQVRQGDERFFIKSADEASRQLEFEPDESPGAWNYPYGNGKTAVCLARKNISMSRNSDWTFANLMYAADDKDPAVRLISRMANGLYLIRDGEKREVAGLRPEALAQAGIRTDSGFFFCDSTSLYLAAATRLNLSNVRFRSSVRVHLNVDMRKGTGTLTVPEGGKAAIETTNFAVGGVPRDGGVIEPGAYPVTFKPAWARGTDPVGILLNGEETVAPALRAGPLKTSGIDVVKKFESPDALTGFCPMKGGMLAGDAMGRILEFRGGVEGLLFRIASGRPVAAIRSADINGDGTDEIVVGDDGDVLFCYKPSGQLLWSYKMSPTNGSAVAADIAVGDIDGKGKPAILVATKSWKLYAFNPDGTVRWESYLFYHPCTRVKILRQDDGKTAIAVGNVYHTPLNVVSPADGRSLWHTWEQCGGEAYSTTDYCGFHLTDMIFIDTDGDGQKEIVFGTKYNRVYALSAADGVTRWSAVVDDEVTVMKNMTDPASGEDCILAGTDAGTLIKLDRRGKRTGRLTLSSGIADVAVIEHSDPKRSDIIVSTRDGGVVVCNHELQVRAALDSGDSTLTAVLPAGSERETNLFYAIFDRSVCLLRYRSYLLRPSRDY